MIVVADGRFKKKTLKLPKEIKLILSERLKLFITDPHNVLLNNHQLHGKLRSYRSINITGDYRLVFEQYDENSIRLIDIDTHSKLYGKQVLSEGEVGRGNTRV